MLVLVEGSSIYYANLDVESLHGILLVALI